MLIRLSAVRGEARQAVIGLNRLIREALTSDDMVPGSTDQASKNLDKVEKPFSDLVGNAVFLLETFGTFSDNRLSQEDFDLILDHIQPKQFMVPAFIPTT